MRTNFVFEKVSVSWTKYDIVHILDVVESWDSLQLYYAQELKLNSSILKSLIGVKELSDPIPDYWKDVFSFDLKIRKYFACFLMLFTHHEIAKRFAEEYMQSPFKGEFVLDGTLGDKVQTNIRSLLVESGLASVRYRRTPVVPFDGSILLNEVETGPVFKLALENYIHKNSTIYDSSEFYSICDRDRFNEVVGMSKANFRTWLEGQDMQPSAIKSISFDRVLCFDQPMKLDFSNSKEVYFVGENGDGKTLLLMALFSACKGYRLKKEKEIAYIAKMVDFMKKIENSHLQVSDDLGRSFNMDSAPPFKRLFAYGVHRGRYAPETDIATFEKCGCMTLFNQDMTLRDPTDWLLKSSLENPSHEELSFDYLTKVLNELLEKRIDIIREDGQILFVEKGMKLTLSEISEGFRSTLIFICDLLIRLAEHTADNENVFEQTGVVMIDEICLHLHPKWQRTIVGKLRKLFPNLQFIMTTHSPIILLGSSKDAVFYRVVREEGHTYISDPYFRVELDAMMLNTIATSSIFGLESASMVGAAEDVDTSDSYVMSRVGHRVEEVLAQKRSEGKLYFPKEFIDELIDGILRGEVE